MDKATISNTLLAHEDWLEVTSTEDLVLCRGRCHLNCGASDICLVLPHKFIELSGGNFAHISIQITPTYDFSLLQYRNKIPWPSLVAGINMVNGRPVIIVAAFQRVIVNENLPFFLHITAPKDVRYKQYYSQEPPQQQPDHTNQFNHAVQPNGQYQHQQIGFFHQQHNRSETMM